MEQRGADILVAAVGRPEMLTGEYVKPGATVIDSVLLPGASVGSGARVERSLVMGAVGSASVVRDSMVGADGRVGDGESLVDATAPALQS